MEQRRGMLRGSIAAMLNLLGVGMSPLSEPGRRDVMPVAQSFAHRDKPMKGSGRRGLSRLVPFKAAPAVQSYANSARHERRTTGITARQQRIRRRDKNGVPSQLRHRRYEAVFNNQRIGRRALRFVDNYMKDYYDDARLWNRGRGRQYSEWRPA